MISTQISGARDDPPIVIVDLGGGEGALWDEAAPALVKAGRSVIRLTAAPELTSNDLRSALADIEQRPVVIGLGDATATILAALREDGPDLAAGLVLANPPADTDWANLALADWPCLIVRIDAQSHLSMAPDDFEHATLETIDDDQSWTEGFNALLIEFLERRVPRSVREYREGSDPRTLRDALGCFATGVTVVTTFAHDGHPIGLTANSFTSVSLDPPLLLVCIARTSASVAAFRATENFAVNVLHIGQQPTSNLFATRGQDRFGDTNWHTGECGTPVLDGSLASFECARHAVHDGGDHIVLVGRVVKAGFEPQRDPLLYFRGRYRRLHFS